MPDRGDVRGCGARSCLPPGNGTNVKRMDETFVIDMIVVSSQKFFYIKNIRKYFVFAI